MWSGVPWLSATARRAEDCHLECAGPSLPLLQQVQAKTSSGMKGPEGQRRHRHPRVPRQRDGGAGLLRHELQQFEAFFAGGLGRNTGVVVTLVRRKLLAKTRQIGFKEVQPGRISRLLIRVGQSHVIVWNVHNDSIEEADMKKAIKK